MRVNKSKGKPEPEQPIEWPRADPAELAAFDPASKTCSMNCGKHTNDPRSYVELRFMCDDCYVNKPRGAVMFTDLRTPDRVISDLQRFSERAMDSMMMLAHWELDEEMFGVRRPLPRC